MDPLPTAAEINVHDSLDEQWAQKHFHGKTLEESEALFRENSLRYWEDFGHMGPKAFRFYVTAGIRYLLSPAAIADADSASCFCGLLEFKLDHDPGGLDPVALREAVCRILASIDRYELETTLYGDVAGRFRALERRLANMPE